MKSTGREFFRGGRGIVRRAEQGEGASEETSKTRERGDWVSGRVGERHGGKGETSLLGDPKDGHTQELPIWLPVLCENRRAAESRQKPDVRGVEPSTY